MASGWAKSLYNSKSWQQCRKNVLIRDRYKCQCYKLLGGYPCEEPAEDVHHIEWLTPANISDPSITLNPDNLISVSWEHHRAIHKGEGDCLQGYEFDGNGQIVPIEVQ